MNPPEQLNLPFFAYGIFKPGQLCFSRIKNLVERTIEGTVKGTLKERDGIPLLVNSNSSQVKGCLIYFHDNRGHEAYQRIMEIEPDEVYRWDTIKVNGEIDANVLLGKRELRGSFDLEGQEEWDGKNDLYFKQGLKEIEEILQNNTMFDWDLRSLLRLQMAYTLLWSAIERYASLKYHLGENPTDKIKQIAKEKCFADSLKKNVKNKREVFRTTDLVKYTLDPNNPKGSIDYYYQVRSNAIHRGKTAVRDFDTMKNSLRELLAIFKDVLGEAFKE